MKSIFKFFIKKLYGKFNGKLFAYASIPGSWVALIYVLAKKKKNQIVMLPTNSIGDTLYVFSFIRNLEALANKTHKQLIVYASERYKQMLKSYNVPAVEFVFLKHLGFMHLLLFTLSFNEFCSNSVIIAVKKQVFAPYPLSYGNYIPKNIIGMRERWSRIFGVPTSPISYHNQAKTKIVSIEAFEEKKHKICIVNPYSNSMYYSELLFEKIVQKLVIKGFSVYTNVVGNQNEIKNSSPLRCSLEELYSIASEIPLVVSIRSGILDYLIPSNINMFVVYETWKTNLGVNADALKDIAIHCSLKEWLPKGNVHESYMENECEESKVLDELDQYLNKLNLGF